MTATPSLTPADLPTSFGSFKPTGHVMLGLPDLVSLHALHSALTSAGWREHEVIDFTPRETVAEMAAMIDNASPLAGFGAEITMMRRYLEEARRGTRWLLVKADEAEALARLTALARAHGARLAVSYRTLVVEELI